MYEKDGKQNHNVIKWVKFIIIIIMQETVRTENEGNSNLLLCR